MSPETDQVLKKPGEEFEALISALRGNGGGAPEEQVLFLTLAGKEGVWRTEEVVPLERIYQRDYLPVDEENVDDLMESLLWIPQGGNKPIGQQDQVWLARIEIETDNGSESVDVVLNGFHRIKAVDRLAEKNLCEPQVLAYVYHGLSWTDICRARAIGAVTHPGVRFARFARLSEDTWTLSPWCRDFGLTDVLANLERPHVLEAMRPRMPKDEIALMIREVSEWAKIWKLDPDRLKTSLMLAAKLERSVVELVREEGKEVVIREPDGELRTLPGISIGTAKEIGRLPKKPDGQEELGVQRQAAKVVMEQGLNTKEAAALVTAVFEAINSRKAVNLRGVLAKDWKTEKGKPGPKAKNETLPDRIEAIHRQLVIKSGEAGKLRTRLERDVYKQIVAEMASWGEINPRITPAFIFQTIGRIAEMAGNASYRQNEVKTVLAELRLAFCRGDDEEIGTVLDRHEQLAAAGQFLLEAVITGASESLAGQNLARLAAKFKPRSEPETPVWVLINQTAQIDSKREALLFLQENQDLVPASVKSVFNASLERFYGVSGPVDPQKLRKIDLTEIEPIARLEGVISELQITIDNMAQELAKAGFRLKNSQEKAGEKKRVLEAKIKELEEELGQTEVDFSDNDLDALY